MALSFITLDDLYVSIRQRHLEELNDDDPNLVEKSERMAMSVIRDHLSVRYDLEAEFAEVDDDRNDTLIRWLTVLTLYFCYQRADEGLRPEWLTDEYKMIMKLLGLIQEGKRSVELEPLIPAGSTEANTHLRTGSLPRRSHGF